MTMTHLKTKRVWQVVGLLGLFVVLVVAHYVLLTEPYPGHNDFLTPWEASRAFFYEGLDPYSEAVSVNIQEYIYGRAALPGEFPNHFAYPFYTIYFTWPVIHVDYAWAAAIWMVASEFMLIGALLLLFDLYGYKPRPITIALLILFVFLSYPGSRALLLGQVSNVVYFLHVVTLWAVIKGRDDLAGVALAASTFKPQMSVLIVPFLLLYALVQRRWQLLGWFAAVFGALVGSSFVLLPTWVEGMLYQITLYPSYIEVSTPAWVVAQYMLGLGSVGEWAINLSFYALTLWTWYEALLRRQPERFMWVFTITLAVTHLVGLRTATTHFVVFLIPLVFYLKLYAKRFPLRTLAVMLALWILPWVHFLLTLDETAFEHPTNFIPLPLLTLLVVWFTRDVWWKHAPRPPQPDRMLAAEEAAL